MEPAARPQAGEGLTPRSGVPSARTGDLAGMRGARGGCAGVGMDGLGPVGYLAQWLERRFPGCDVCHISGAVRRVGSLRVAVVCIGSPWPFCGLRAWNYAFPCAAGQFWSDNVGCAGDGRAAGRFASAPFGCRCGIRWEGGDGRMGGKGSRVPGRHESRDPDGYRSRLAWWAAWLTFAASVISLLAALLAFWH
jgi:hypothetical protein